MQNWCRSRTWGGTNLTIGSTLFRGTVDDLFVGENAEHIKSCAADMANVIFSRINHVPDPRFDPANLTPEQRERYARYKSQPQPATP
jgi:hemoglobin